MWRWHHIAAGVCVSALLHGGVALLTAWAPELVVRPEPRRERVRMVDRPRQVTPEPDVAAPVVTPNPATPPLALPDLAPLEPIVVPTEQPAAVAIDTASAAPKRSVRRRKRKRRRAPGRTLTARAGSSSPASAAPEGGGGALDLGAWDPTAERGDSSRAPELAGAAAERPPPSASPAPAAPRPKDTEIYELIPPRPLSRPSGRYPPGVSRSSGSVVVQLSLQVSTTGEVQSATILSGQGDALNAEARRLARTIKFKPGRRGGVAVAMRVPWRVTFR